MSNEAARYRQRVLATLDTMRTHEKDRLIIGLIDALYPNGDPDYSQVLAALRKRGPAVQNALGDH
jgi:hypothetical protein